MLQFLNICMEEFLKFVADVGFPTAAAATAGYFIYLLLKFILAGVTSSIRSLSTIIVALENRVKTMNHDIIRVDVLMSHHIGVKPDVSRIARANGKDDARKD